MMFKNCISLCILSIVIAVGSALYEDQVGKFDWKTSYIGEVIFGKIDTDGKKLVAFVATERNVVAALNVKKGEIVWRHLLESGDDGFIRAFHVGNEVVTVSGSGPFMVRGWNKSSGLQLYEWSTPTSLPKDGMWTVDHLKAYQVRVGSNMAELTGFHLKSGNPAGSTRTITSSWISSPTRCTVQNGALSCLSADGNGITSMTLADLSVKSGSVNAGSDIIAISSVGNGLFIGKSSRTSKVAAFDASGSLTAHEVRTDYAVTVHKTNGGTVLVKAYQDPAKPRYLNIESTVLETKKTSKFDVHHKLNLARPIGVSAFCSVDASGSPKCLALVSMEDEALCLAHSKNELFWIREEALANVIGVEMVDLPVSDEEAALETELANKGGGVVGMLFRRLNSQVLQLHNLVSAILGLIDPSVKASREQQLVKDSFGLRKLILISTKRSKVFAIDNKNGEIIWQTYLSQAIPLKTVDSYVSPVYVLRSARHIPYSTIAAILFREKMTGNLFLYQFDPITGSTKDGGSIMFKKKIRQCMRLPEADDDFINGLVLLMEDGSVEVFPPKSFKTAHNLSKKLYMYVADPESALITGYRFSSNLEAGKLESHRAWTVKLKEKIVSVVGKRREEKVHSQGRVLGDRSVLYKYANPNLVVIATASPDQVHKSVVSIFLLDTVSGHIVFSAVHKRASEPVHVVHSENWIVYSFFSEKSRRTEMITLDLYEGITQRNTTAFSSLEVPIEPLIERQAYIFPHNIVSMKETITEKGITSKHVLIAMTSGGVMEMPWVLLDPRRSVAPTPEMREEGIVPYIPELGLPHEAIITYNYTLEAIQGIHTSPSGLESTCLVFIYGLDHFYTRVTPSKTFDVLKDDFEYWLITAVLTGLVTAAYVTKRLASRKALMLAWK